MKRFLNLFLIIQLLFLPALALELDASIDDEIRKNYNPDKIEKDYSSSLPPLPGFVKKRDSAKQNLHGEQHNLKYIPESYFQEAVLTEKSKIMLKRGTKIKVRLLNNISDRTPKGTRLQFVSLYPVSTTYFTIPSGTKFYGRVVSSHGPQLSANGGLIKIKIDSFSLNYNDKRPVNAYVTKTESKKIFLNNIKGKRKYISSMIKSTKPGRHFFNKMMRITGNLAVDGSSIILTPFSVFAGVLALGGNIAVSPLIAVFYKGKSVYLNSGSIIELKVAENTFIYK